jgi:glycosyltransferase involved in cell wall biosynthesis
MGKKIFIIGHTFPEPTTTAAGSRMMQLIKLFIKEGFQVTFGSAASTSDKSADLHILGITSENLKLNHPSFDILIAKLEPTIVLFDRYITEEQFGWRVAEHCPNALRVLDTEDLHFLRKAREVSFKKHGNLNDLQLYTDTAKRELASILRSDLSLIISEIEMALLIDIFHIPEGLLQYLPFLPKSLAGTLGKIPEYEERNGFIAIGNFYHAPNVDSVKWLHKEIWPAIRKQLPEATLSVFGAYAPQQILELHSERNGFFIKGWAPSVEEVMCAARICLAPIRFGAGLKGKLLDAMSYGTPAVTTTIGAEGMYGAGKDAGGIEDDVARFANCAVTLYSEKRDWLVSQQTGFEILDSRFNAEGHSKNLLDKIKGISEAVVMHRNDNFIGQILQHHTLQASKYMSKWIESKNQESL